MVCSTCERKLSKVSCSTLLTPPPPPPVRLDWSASFRLASFICSVLASCICSEVTSSSRAVLSTHRAQ